MRIPEHIPGRRLLAILLVVYGAIWIPIEGNPASVVLLALLVTVYLLAALLQSFVAGRTLALAQWLLFCAGAGLLAGLGSVLLTLFFMALKSGLHGHGPEFTPEQIEQVISQTPVWALGGLLIGLGTGLLWAGLRRSGDPLDEDGPT